MARSVKPTPPAAPEPPKSDLAPAFFDPRTFDPADLPGGLESPLAREMVTYRDRFDELLEHAGEYVVIKGDRVLGFYPSRARAFRAAVKEFGPSNFLIKKVAEKEPIINLDRFLY